MKKKFKKIINTTKNLKKFRFRNFKNLISKIANKLKFFLKTSMISKISKINKNFTIFKNFKRFKNF